MASPLSLTVLTSYTQVCVFVFVPRHKYTQLLLLADPSHHPACGEESSAQLLTADSNKRNSFMSPFLPWE